MSAESEEHLGRLLLASTGLDLFRFVGSMHILGHGSVGGHLVYQPGVEERERAGVPAVLTVVRDFAHLASGYGNWELAQRRLDRVAPIASQITAQLFAENLSEIGNHD